MGKRKNNDSESKWSNSEGYIDDNKSDGSNSSFVLVSALCIIVLVSAVVILGSKLSDYLRTPEDPPLPTGDGLTLLIRESDYSITDNGFSVQEIYAMVRESVVTVNTYSDGESLVPVHSVTGTAVSADGYILTNALFVRDAEYVEVVLFDGRVLDARLMGFDDVSDVAVLKVTAANLKPAQASYASIGDGERVVAVCASNGLSNCITSGVVSAGSRAVNYECPAGPRCASFIQTDIPLSASMTGGVMFNRFGQLTGLFVTTFDSHEYPGAAFALALSAVGPTAESLVNNFRVEGRAWLGVCAEPMSDFAAARGGYPSGGLRLTFVDPESDLAKLGYEVGDLIVEVNSARCYELGALLSAVSDKKPGDTIRLLVYSKRDSRSAVVDAVLGED